MDEPLATLDRCAKREVLPYLKRLNSKLAVPMIVRIRRAPSCLTRCNSPSL